MTDFRQHRAMIDERIDDLEYQKRRLERKLIEINLDLNSAKTARSELEKLIEEGAD